MQESPATDAAGVPGVTRAAAHDPRLGRTFAEALGRKDFDAVMALLDETIDFRGLTPERIWAANDAQAVVDGILRQWFEETDQLEEILSITSDCVADRHRVAYRFRGTSIDGPFIVEQQAYYTESGGRIGWMRVLCSGFRTR